MVRMQRIIGRLMVMSSVFGVQVSAEPLLEGRVRLSSGPAGRRGAGAAV